MASMTVVRFSPREVLAFGICHGSCRTHTSNVTIIAFQNVTVAISFLLRDAMQARPCRRVIYTAPDSGKLVTLITGKHRRLLFARDGRLRFMRRSLILRLRRRQQNRIRLYAVAYLKPQYNNKRLHSRYCTVEAN